MKKIICLFLILCLLFTAAGCRKKVDPPYNETQDSNTTEGTSNQIQQIIDTDTSLVAVSVPTVTEDTTASDGTVVCQYTYPSMALVLDKPEVADKIIINFLNRVDITTQPAADTADMAKGAYNGDKNFVPYLYHVTYSPMRIDHKVLSLFGNNVVFSGGGHPERTCVSASYDLLTGDVLTLASIMSKDAKSDDFCQLVLSGLSEIAEGNYLYKGYAETVKQRFKTDASQDEAWYFTQTGLCFYFAPYEIAPYASGVISVEIPYEKLRNLLHESYLPLARNAPTGIHKVQPFDQVKLEDFSHIAEIVANKEGKMYIISADSNIQDVRILFNDKASNYTVFAAYNLSPGDGIMVQADQSQLSSMRLSYKTGSETVTAPLAG